MHIFPQLRKLEEKYQEELVVVGVHSAKFTSEKDTANIEKAIRRLELEHPVVNDKDFRVWSQYSARAWPTLYVVDPEGNILGRHEGEITFDAFDRVIRDMITEFEVRGTLDRTPIPGLSVHKEEGGTLSFPSKIIADEKGSRLFVSDSNHNRVLSISLDGEILDVIGGGDVGLEDGDYADAKFHHPHGLTLSGDSLYVADTENHAIRRIDLRERRVETIAGTGEQARTFHDGGVGSVALNSPWDLTCLDGMLYIAMAGFHQLWVMHLESGYVGPFAGSGREGIKDGSLRNAMLAQPTGIDTDGDTIYFADSETSAVRTATRGESGKVNTLVGTGLFDFGDKDGVGDRALLQHVQGVCWHEGMLYITDTYNNKIKRIEPLTQAVVSFTGLGDTGFEDGPAREALFYEPEGLAIANGKMYIADTNNHAIRVATLSTGSVSTLELKD
jgi:DNA-binding beta-propeller fold protein YncE